MNRKFIVSVVVIFVLTVVIGYIVHGALLRQDYMQLANLTRPQQQMASYYPFMLLAQLLFSIGFVWIYQKGRENKPFLPQGVRYGIAIAILATIPTYLIYYALYPIPDAVVVKQIVFDTIGVVILGVAVAWLNK